MSNDIKNRIKELSNERMRHNKAVLTTQQRLDQLGRIYDACLFLLEESVLLKSMKGTGTLTMLLERCRIEATELGATNKAHNKNEIVIRYEHPPATM